MTGGTPTVPTEFTRDLRQTLLRVTDVERQPFRSMGFVSVIIACVPFAPGLRLVLL